jgi:hypothetical protein
MVGPDLLEDCFEHMANTAANVDYGHSIVVTGLADGILSTRSGYISGGRSSWADMAEANCDLISSFSVIISKQTSPQSWTAAFSERPTGLRHPFDYSMDGTIMFSACMMLKLALMKSPAWGSLSFSDWDVAAKLSLLNCSNM